MRTVQAKTSQYISTDDTRAGATLLARCCVSSSCAVAEVETMTQEQKRALQFMEEKNIGAIWVNGQWVWPEDIRNELR